MSLVNYDTEWEVEKAVYNALKADSELGAIVSGRIFDHVPSTAPGGGHTQTPYITIGADTATEWDTKTEIGEEITVMIHLWSTYKGRKEVKQMQGHIKRILHDTLLDIDGHQAVVARREYTDTRLDPDGSTMHGVCRYRYLVRSI